MTPIELLLLELELRLDVGAGEIAVEGGASAVGGGLPVVTDPNSAAGFRIGFGSPPDVPPAIVERFDDLFEPPRAGPGTWLRSTQVIDGTDASRWSVLFTPDGIDLWGVETIAPGSVRVPGIFELGAAEVRIALRVTDGALTSARVELTGSATCTADLAGLGLASSGVANPDGTFDGRGSWKLQIEIGSTKSLDELLDDPGRVLDTPFDATLHVELGYRTLTFFGGQLPATQVSIDAAVSSQGDGELRLDRLAYEQVSSGDLVLGALVVRDAELASTLEGWSTAGTGVSLRLDGRAGVVLPSVLDPAASGTAFTTTTSFVSDAEGVRFELAADRITVDPAINVLELANAQLVLVGRLAADGSWSLGVRGAVVQSWGRIARRLRTVGLRLYAGAGFPNLAAAMELSVSSTGGLVDTDFALDLRLVDGNGGAYRGPLGPLPVDVADVVLALSAKVDDGQLVAWSATGNGSVSSGPGLRDLLPFGDVGISASVGLPRDDDPSAVDPAPSGHTGDLEVALTVTNLPPMTVPSLAGGGSIELFQVDAMQIWISDRLEVTASVRLLPSLRGPGLADRLGMDGWEPLLEPLGTAIGNLRGWFRFVVPFGAGPLRAEIELAPATPPILDLAAMTLEVAEAVAGALDVSVPDDGRQLVGSFAVIEPTALRFVAEIGATSSLSLSAVAMCTLLGERFDTMLTIAVVNGAPEMTLLAGVDDPIHVALSAGSLFDAAAAVDIPAMLEDFGVPATKRSDVRAALESMHSALVDFFTAPGMEFDLAFEIRNLGVTLRPTDGDRMLQAGGALRLTQLPGWLESVLPGGGPSAVLSTSVSSVRIELQMPTADEGATRVEPIFEYDFSEMAGAPPRTQLLSLVLRSLMIEYNWASNSVRVGWDVGFNLPTLNMVEQYGSGIALPDVSSSPFEQLATSGKFGLTATSPPIPTLEWNFTSGDPSDTSQRGLELVVGVPHQRFLTLFSRQFSLFPTYMLGQPALVVDGGVIIGNPPETIDPDGEFTFMAEVQGGVVQIVPAPLGVLVNPLALVPPFLTPQPPYWLLPPTYMADLYADAIRLVFNVPGIVGVDVTVERPMPSLGLPALLELALLAASGFEVAQIPATSPIRKICYARMSIQARLPIVELLGGGPVPTLDEELEVNVADLMELVLQLVSGVRDTLEAGTDLVDRLVREPDAIVRAIPPTARRFAADLEIGGLVASGSLQLLTSEELLEEVVLYHEGTRRRRRGVAALDDPCAAVLAHHVTPVTTVEVRGAIWSRQWRVHVDPRRATPTTNHWSSARSRARRALDAAVSQRDRLVGAVIDDRAKRVHAAIEAVVDRLAKADDLSGSFAKVDQAGLDPLVVAVHDAFTDVIAQVGNPPSGGALGTWRRNVAAQVVQRVLAGPAFTVGVGEAGDLAALVADGLFPATRTGRGEVRIAMTDPADWPAMVAKVTGLDIAKCSPLERDLLALAERLLAAVGGRTKMSRNEYGRLRKQLVDGLIQVLSGVPRSALIDQALLLDVVSGRAAVARFDDRWTWDDRLLARTGLISLYDADVSTASVQRSLASVEGLAFDPGATEPVERPVGWEVVVHERVMPALVVVFTPPLVVTAPRAEVAVRFRSGQYEVVVRGHDGGELASARVPDAVLAHPEAGPPGPARLDRLRAMFAVVERRVPDVVVRLPEQVCSAAHLYQDSLFARPEYRIDPDGDSGLVGVHGPLSLADLLRDPATGEYVVTPGPVLVAGLVVALDLGDAVAASLRLTGLVAPELTTGAQSAVPAVTYSVYLEGFSSLTVRLPCGLTLELEGSFTLLTGELWNTAFGLDGGSSLRVDGSVVLRRNSRRFFEGAVSGSIVQRPAGVDLDLAIDVEVEIDQEVEVAGNDLARLWTSTATGTPAPSRLAVALTFVDGALSITATSSVMISLAVAQLEIDFVEIVAETTVCSWVPEFDTNGLPVLVPLLDGDGNPIPFMFVPSVVKACVTMPAVSLPVPTIGELGRPVTFGCGVTFSLSIAGVEITLEVTPPNMSPFAVPLGDLLPGL